MQFKTQSYMVAALLAIILSHYGAVQAQTVKLKWVEAGAQGQMSPVHPHSIDLAEQKPVGVTRIPADVTKPLYGEFALGPLESQTHFRVLLDAPPGKPSRLFVDANGNGDFTDDPKPQWEAKPYGGSEGRSFTQYLGGVTVPVRFGKGTLPLHLTLQRFDPADPTREGFKGAILYLPDYAREGDLKLGEKSYHVMLLDALVGGDFRGLVDSPIKGIFLMIDVNGNGVFDARGEIYDLGQPFNIGGITYTFKDVTASGESMELIRSPRQVAEIPPPPDLRIGKVVPAFTKKTMDGATVHFPADYHGKLVLLSFWASDCGFCTEEMPEVAKSYMIFHDSGLEILGVSLDHEYAAARINEFAKRNGMTWPEICDGKWLDSDIAQLYFIRQIPYAILVDGDTGKVLAKGDDLRKENLMKTLATALTERKKVARTP